MHGVQIVQWSAAVMLAGRKFVTIYSKKSPSVG